MNEQFVIALGQNALLTHQGGRSHACLGPSGWHYRQPFPGDDPDQNRPYLYSKILAILAALVLWGPWMLTVLLQFAHELW